MLDIDAFYKRVQKGQPSGIPSCMTESSATYARNYVGCMPYHVSVQHPPAWSICHICWQHFHIACTRSTRLGWGSGLQGGRMSQYLESLKIGDAIDVKGPLGHFVYLGQGNFRHSGHPGRTTTLSMVAGGTGITPMWQVIQVCPAPHQLPVSLAALRCCATAGNVNVYQAFCLSQGL